ncbi:hypothetical protein GQ44DRAFT_323274 [Phaeosphaeriaceae sp. PMI808]|nr:hypothetical protein GQ44DRAFT_323274 [Phaeosphaeriaceae sp. PMI808]
MQTLLTAITKGWLHYMMPPGMEFVSHGIASRCWSPDRLHDLHWKTPLHGAASNGHVDVVRLLRERIDVSRKYKNRVIYGISAITRHGNNPAKRLSWRACDPAILNLVHTLLH